MTDRISPERLEELLNRRNVMGRDYLDRHADDFRDTIRALRELQSLRAKVKGRIELRPDDYADKSIMDEIVAENCRVHLERMDEYWYCLIVETDERRVMVSIGTARSYRRKVNAKVYEDVPK